MATIQLTLTVESYFKLNELFIGIKQLLNEYVNWVVAGEAGIVNTSGDL